MINKYYFTGLFILSFSFITTVQADTNDFDHVCHYFEELSKKPNINKMTNTQRNVFIIKHINDNLAYTSHARTAWIAIENAMADVRYELFKSSAEDTLQKAWHCVAMKKWAVKTGAF